MRDFFHCGAARGTGSWRESAGTTIAWLRPVDYCVRGGVFAVILAVAGVLPPLAAPARAVPAPEIEYIYNVAGRRHYSFPNNDALGYGHAICDAVSQGRSYEQVMADAKRDVTPNDEFASNFLVSNAVNILCPEQIWRLRSSAAGYQPPPA